MFSINENIQKTLSINGIKTRPNANAGFWLSFLLPFAINWSLVKNQEILSQQYKLASLTSFGLCITSVIFIIQCIRCNNYKISALHYLSAIYISSLFYTCLHKGFGFSILSGFITTFMYYKGLPLILKLLPLSFTFGEASLVVQGIILFLYMFIINVNQTILFVPTKVSHITTLILQFGITGLGIIAILVYKFHFFRKMMPFYILTGTVILSCILLPLQILLRQNPIVFILEMLSMKFETVRMLIFWTICSIFAIHAVNVQIQTKKKANTVIRKIFHVLAVVVFLPGLIDQCSLLYLASGIVFAVFFALEMLRILNIPPFGESLQNGFKVFSDEKDVGLIAFTPIYLLVGCALPLWLHPNPCDMTDSAGFNLLPLTSGLLTIGVGDTLASTVGTWSGRYKWPGSHKSVEGTLACMISQAVALLALIYSGHVVSNFQNVTKATVAIVASSLIEANTAQVDNLILPLISYLILL